MCGICTVHVERHQRAQTQVAFEPDSSLLFDLTVLHTNSLQGQKKKQQNKTQQQHIYINIFTILLKGLCQLCLRLCIASLTDPEHSTYAHHRKSRGTASLALQRSSVFKGFAFTLSCALYRSFFNHKPKYRCR